LASDRRYDGAIHYISLKVLSSLVVEREIRI